jgi:hypothetical protein
MRARARNKETVSASRHMMEARRRLFRKKLPKPSWFLS